MSNGRVVFMTSVAVVWLGVCVVAYLRRVVSIDVFKFLVVMGTAAVLFLLTAQGE
jgi:hypothetical protein